MTVEVNPNPWAWVEQGENGPLIGAYVEGTCCSGAMTIADAEQMLVDLQRAIAEAKQLQGEKS